MPTNSNDKKPNTSANKPEKSPASSGVKVPNLKNLAPDPKTTAEKNKVESKSYKEIKSKNEEIERHKIELDRYRDILNQKKQKEEESHEKIKPLKKQRKKSKKAYSEKLSDDELGNLSGLGNRVLTRRAEEKGKRILIILLLILLLASLASATYVLTKSGEDVKLDPVKVNIILESTNVELTEPVDPDNPDAGVRQRLLYPGDTFGIDFTITNAPNLNSFPIFIRFRAYVELEEKFEPFVFIPTFKDNDLWFRVQDVDGHILGDNWAYYGGYVLPGEEYSIHAIEALTLSQKLVDERYEGKTFTLCLQVEAIRGSLDAVNNIDEWGLLSPQAWKDYIASLDVPE